MLCRRCGMESSTTDVCEWCKRPMLPEGATLSKKPLGGEKAPPQGEEVAAAEGEQKASAQQPELPEAGPQAGAPEAPVEQEPVEHVLRPLGADAPAPRPVPSGPSHGLSEEATRTSVDIRDYMGSDQSIFRPLTRPESKSTLISGSDPLAMRRARAREERKVSEISENVRLIRCFVGGLAVCVLVSIVQYLVTAKTPTQLYFLRLGSEDNIVTALLFGAASGVLLGGMLGALLVRLQKGPFLGLMIGAFLGWVGLQNGYWGLAMGVLSGIITGRFATVGIRRVLQV